MTYQCEATPTAAILPAPRCSRATASASAADSADQPPAGRAAKRLVCIDDGIELDGESDKESDEESDGESQRVGKIGAKGRARRDRAASSRGDESRVSRARCSVSAALCDHEHA